MSQKETKASRKDSSKVFISETMELILDCSSDGIWITDGEGVVLYVNRANEEMIGVTKDEMLGKKCSELVEEKIFKHSATMESIKKRKVVTMMGFNYQTNLHVLITSTPILDSKGDVQYVINNVRDITQLQRTMEELQYKEQVIIEQNQEIHNLLHLKKSKKISEHMVAASPAMLRILEMAQRVGQFESTVLLMGESGVGKEVVADEIVRSSLRSGKSFVKVNCGAIPENLIESELFGYEAGAFTGASRNGKMGLFELADHGTILLDEIGELPPQLQVKLLRVLQDRCIQRVGGTKKKEVDIRVIAATNADLKKMVDEGEFRRDLYYRLNVVTIQIPPLRQRTEDIPQLIHFYTEKYTKKYNIGKEFSEECIRCMMKYPWPGNIRELQNVVENLVIMTDGPKIEVESLPEQFKAADTQLQIDTYLLEGMESSLKDTMRNIETQIILRAMEKYNNTRDVARVLGVNQSTIVRKLQQARDKEL